MSDHYHIVYGRALRELQSLGILNSCTCYIWPAFSTNHVAKDGTRMKLIELIRRTADR